MTTLDQDARSIFLAALGIAPNEWAAYLNEACGENAELRARVNQLLNAHQVMGSIHGGAKSDQAVTAAEWQLSERPGTVIGPYKLLQQIGEGGMGVVFMAEQSEPIQRTVALKIIKPGMDTRQVIARFEAERQALAMMDHPNIARVIDAGTTGQARGGEGETGRGGEPDEQAVHRVSPSPSLSLSPSTSTGRPYFVMDLVKGVPITDYCDQQQLTIRQRLELFTQVCHAVQHAHQKGIIHRDLKPSNVLVAEYDGKPVPKVIDFGVAKATAQRLTERTMFTQYGQIVGTFEYMSPEQARFNQLDVDTRSDIYSLGVLLYELLAGSTPLEKERLRTAAFDEILRLIREEEPPRPSTRLSNSSLPSAGRAGEGGSSPATIAANRQTEPARLSKELSGELDWIVMKCLEKDRNRRYETATGLGRDIERYLNDEAVQACPPSAAYRLKKFIRRNKSAAAFVALLIAGIAALAVSNVQTKRSEQRAITESAKAQAISDLLQGMLASANPDAAKGAEYTVRKLLDDFSAGLDTELSKQPEVEAEIHATIGRAYWRLGVPDVADAHITKALELRRSIFGPDHEKVAENLVDYAWNLAEQGRHAEAETNIREALRIYRLRGASTEQLIHAQWSLQRFLISLRRLDDAEAVAKVALALADDSAGEYPDVANILHAMADAQNQQGRYDEAVKSAQQAVKLHRKVHGPKQPETAWGLRALAQPLINQKKYSEAEVALREALDIFRESYGSEHKSVSFTFADLQKVFLANGDKTKLEIFARQQLELLTTNTDAKDTEQYKSSQRSLAEAHFNLGDALRHQEKYDESAVAYHKAIEIDPKHSSAYINLALDLIIQHKYDEAVAASRKAIELNPQISVAYNNLAIGLRNQHKYDESVAAYRKAIELNPRDFAAYTNLGSTLHVQSRLDEAVDAYRKAIELAPERPEPYLNLGNVLTKQSKLDEAVSAYRKTIDIKPRYNAFVALGDVLLKLGKNDHSLAAYRKAVELQPDLASELGDPEDWFSIAIAHWRLGTTKDAQKWFAKADEWMKKNSPDDPVLRKSRAEAAEVLGIKEEPIVDKPSEKTKDDQSNTID